MNFHSSIKSPYLVNRKTKTPIEKQQDEIDALKNQIEKIQNLLASVINKKSNDVSFIISEKKGEKGEKGDRGERGERGERGLKGDKGDRGERGEAGKNGIDGIDGKDGRDGKNGESVNQEEVINGFFESLIKGKKKLKTENIDGLEQTMSAFRHQLAKGYLHGGGMTLKAGTGQTLSQNSDGTWTLTPQSLSFETPTGAVDGSNTSFTVLNTPKSIIMDGTIHFENYGYTLSGLTITTDRAPVLYIKSMY